MKRNFNLLKLATCLVGVVLAMLAGSVHAQKASAPAAFSFDVYGDSRSMMYLPYKQDQEAEARQLMVDMFELVLPAKMSQDVVDKHVKLTYDPSSHELVQMIMPFDTMHEVTTLTLDRGWVTEASVEDVKLLPGVRRAMFRLQGGKWVAREAVRDVNEGNADFIVHTGDLVWWGKQGDTPSDNPYWKLVDEEVKIVQTGTSSQTPEKIADSWQAAATTANNLNQSLNKLNVNGKITRILFLSTRTDPRQEVELEGGGTTPQCVKMCPRAQAVAPIGRHRHENRRTVEITLVVRREEDWLVDRLQVIEALGAHPRKNSRQGQNP